MDLLLKKDWKFGANGLGTTASRRWFVQLAGINYDLIDLLLSTAALFLFNIIPTDLFSRPARRLILLWDGSRNFQDDTDT
mmetsp:Transcript_40114/g.83940  ORF Transcript_40114/g.83940 Transcript_40114/m.83940 type:complete len:80 (-) Transcript_40114:603-842(-)